MVHWLSKKSISVSIRLSHSCVELLGSYMENNASQARADTHRCIVRALKYLNVFLFDHLVPLKPVKFLEGELIHDLLTIFVSAKLVSYVKFHQTNKDFIDSLGLLHEQNMATMRLLTFMGMAVKNKEISFDTVQQELQIGANGVDACVIGAGRTKTVLSSVIVHGGHLENSNGNNSTTHLMPGNKI